jgi:predicted O-methyltransferase YrrM
MRAMNKLLRTGLLTLPVIGARLREILDHRAPHPPGDASSPYPSLADVARRADGIFGRRTAVPGIDLRTDAQLELLEKLKNYYSELPFSEHPQSKLRYYFDNPMFGHADAIFLYAMLRHFKPRKVIEVGSGFSSALMLDVIDSYPDVTTSLTFCEPFPARLQSLLRETDLHSNKVVVAPIQDVPLEIFDELESGDFLFLDTTHIVKTGGDVNTDFFEILPRIAAGVYVHIHDIFFPFEYPREWVERQRAYTEIYIARAFLMYNDHFQIELFPNYLIQRQPAWFSAEMPLCLRNPGGSLWLRKVR